MQSRGSHQKSESSRSGRDRSSPRGGREAGAEGPSGQRVRLQRVLADAGVAARKQCERLIETGHVEVNGERVEKLPVFVNPETDDIRVDGRRIKPTTRHVYLMWHKPARVLATPPMDELESRPSVSDYVDHPTAPRLFPVGTLGFEASGLMLLTSNTRAATLLSHPRSRVERVYNARVKGTPAGLARSKLRKGVQVLMPEHGREPPGGAKRLSGASNRASDATGRSGDAPRRKSMERGVRPGEKPDRPKMRRVRLEIRSLDPSKHGAGGGEESSAGNTSIEILTTEPRDEYVAQAMHLVGHPVRKLARLSIGPIRMREVGPGAWRELTREEMKALRLFLDELALASGIKPARSGGAAGAARGPGRRKPRVVGGTKRPANAPNAGASLSEQQSDEEAGVDPEEFED